MLLLFSLESFIQLSCIFGGIWRYDVGISKAKFCYFGGTVSL